VQVLFHKLRCGLVLYYIITFFRGVDLLLLMDILVTTTETKKQF